MIGEVTVLNSKVFAILGACILAAFPIASFAQNPPPQTMTFALKEFDVTGQDISDRAQLVAVSGFPREDHSVGYLGLGAVSSVGNLDRIKVPAGLLPFDPKFSQDGALLTFAGLCWDEAEPCFENAAGWNIFQLDIQTTQIEQVTQPDLTLVRWKPVFDEFDQIYFAGFTQRSRERLSIAWSISPTVIFKVLEGGNTEAVFPTNPYHPTGGYIRHPIANFKGLDLVSVRDGIITVRASLDGNNKRMNWYLDSYLEEGAKPDPRMTEAADRLLYSKPKKFGLYQIGGTIFFLSDKGVQVIGNHPDLQGKLSKNPSVTRASESGGILYNLSGDYSRDWYGKIWALDGGNVRFMPTEPTDSVQFRDFNVSGSLAIAGTDHRKDATLSIMDDWKVIQEIDTITFKGE